jgi:hypothetical protein
MTDICTAALLTALEGLEKRSLVVESLARVGYEYGRNIESIVYDERR